MRFQAPDHIMTAWLSTGPVAVEDGRIEIAGDLPQGDLRGLAAAGFVALPASPPAAAAPAIAPAKPRPAPLAETK